MKGGETGIDEAAARVIELASKRSHAEAEEAARTVRLAAGEDRRGQAVALCASGVVHHSADNYPAAVDDLAAALRLAEDLADRPLQATVLARLGSTLSTLGNSGEAIERLGRALALATEVGDSAAKCVALRGLANVYARLEDIRPAIEYAQRAVEIARGHDDEVATIDALRALGNVHGGEAERRGHLGQANQAPGRKAIDSYEEAIPLTRKVGSRPMEMMLVNNIAHTLRIIGRYREAAEQMEDALAQDTEDLTDVDLSLLYCNLGAARLGMGQAVAALTPLREALRLAEGASSLIHLPKMHLALAEAYESVGDANRALDHHKAYHEVERRLHGSDIRSKALLAAVQLEKQELARESDRWREESATLTQELGSLREEANRLRDEIRRDPLTTLANRRTFDVWLRRLVDAAGRSPVSVALIDVDRFKEINDTYSHRAGDDVLRQLGHLLEGLVRQGDLAARYGGEEFALVLAGTPLSEAARVCERVRRAVADADWSAVGTDLQVTVSAGVSQEVTAPRALAVADQRLYAAKLAGRNRVVAH